ncbi:MAG: hypothetical protein J5525_12310 [Lachnospiraceae bacterium]|nr:hypothetical protein [Lachnospiraceae bacterium]
MKLIDLLEVIDENACFEVIDYDEERILSSYNGRDSIDKCYNNCEVVRVGSLPDGTLYAGIKCSGIVKKGFRRLNDEPIKIECVEDEHEEANDFKPSFWFNNKRYFIENFPSVNSPWVGGTWPEFIHAFEAEEYVNPIYIEIIDGAYVNVYESVMIESEE